MEKWLDSPIYYMLWLFYMIKFHMIFKREKCPSVNVSTVFSALLSQHMQYIGAFRLSRWIVVAVQLVLFLVAYFQVIRFQVDPPRILPPDEQSFTYQFDPSAAMRR